MAIQSTQGSAAYGCVSPVIGVSTFVTKANAASGGINTTSNSTVLHSSMSFRATSNGDLHTFDDLLLNSAYNQNGSVTIPSSGNTSGYDWSGSVDVKRPSCECTRLYKFRGAYRATAISYMIAITFEDGYSIEVGRDVHLLRIDNNGLSFIHANSLSVGDQIVKCGYPGSGRGQVGSSCTLITAKSSVVRNNIKIVQALETYWPQDQDGSGTTFSPDLSSSEIRGVLQLENGVYIFFIPNGGDY